MTNKTKRCCQTCGRDTVHSTGICRRCTAMSHTPVIRKREQDRVLSQIFIHGRKYCDYDIAHASQEDYDFDLDGCLSEIEELVQDPITDMLW